MKRKKIFNTMEEAKKILGDDFWEVMSDVLPFIGPKVDMYRAEQEIIIAAELPGILSQNDISLYLEGYTLVIEGKISRNYAKDEEAFIISERVNGPLKRKLRIPKDCALEMIEADYWNGLLVVRIPIINNSNPGMNESVPINFHN